MKKICILVVLSMLLSVFTIPAYTYEQTEADSVELGLLKAVGIADSEMESGVSAKKSVTRAEFAKYSVRMLGQTVSMAGHDVIFKDVDSSNPYFSYITLAFTNKIVNGDSEGYFSPNDNVALPEAVKMIVSALGYQEKANYQGGYPAGYNKVATELGLLKGVNTEQPFTYDKLVKLIYNAVHAPYAVSDSFGSDSVEYIQDPDITVLTELFKIYNSSGILYANKMTKLDGFSDLPNDRVSFKASSGKIYTYSTKLKLELGFYYRYYFKQETDDSQKEIIFVDEKGKNKVLEISSDDLIGYDDLKYSYEQNDITKTARIKSENVIIYNGVVCLPSGNEDFIPKYGSVRLIDNNNDNVYEIVNVNDVITNCAESFSALNLFIKDKYNLGSIGLKDNVKDYVIYKNGEEIEFSDIDKWNILTIKKSKTAPYTITIEVTDKFIAGKVDSISDKDKLIVDGKEYKLAKNIIDGGAADLINYNKEYTFYLDAYGRIAGIESDVFTKDEYVWFVNAAIKNEAEDKLVLKVYTKNRKFESLEIADKVVFNGASDLTNTEILNILKPSGKTKYDLLKIEYNNEGLIRKIETPKLGNEYGSPEFSKYYFDAKISYKSTHKMFNGEFFANDETLVFLVPSAAADVNDVTKYDYFKITELLETSYTGYTAYDIDETGLASVVVLASGGLPVGIEDNEISACIVEKVTNAVDKDGEIRQKIYYWEKMLKSLLLFLPYTENQN